MSVTVASAEGMDAEREWNEKIERKTRREGRDASTNYPSSSLNPHAETHRTLREGERETVETGHLAAAAAHSQLFYVRLYVKLICLFALL